MLHDQYVIQSTNPIRNSEPISPLHASVDPRFSTILTRAVNHQEKVSQQQVSPTSWVHSPSTITINSNAWQPTETANKQLVDTPKKSCLSAAWKNRLQGLMVGLIAAAISTGTALGILLTKPSASSTATTTTAPACSSLQWSQSSTTVAGNGTYGNASNELAYPWGIYVDTNYALYVADYYNHRVQKWLPNAENGTTVAGITGVQGSNSSLLSYPMSVCVDSQQNVYVGDNYGIGIWSPGASVSNRVAGSSSITPIYAIFVDNNGNLYASTYWSCAIQMWTPTATASTIVAGGNGCGYSSSQLFYPYSFTVDSSTNTVYVANTNADTIVAWPARATTGTIIAGRNLTYGAADFLLYNPYDVKRDQYGNLYVADSSNNRVLLFCQNPSSTSASIIAGYKLSYPRSIALDPDLNLYVVTNSQVQKYTRIV